MQVRIGQIELDLSDLIKPGVDFQAADASTSAASLFMDLHETDRTCNAQEAPGSSPRVRGTGQSERFEAGRRRFIPACAGNSVHAIAFRLGLTC